MKTAHSGQPPPEETRSDRSAAPASVPACEGRLLHIFISPGHDYWGRQGEGRLQHGIREVREIEAVAGKGLRGDRYFDCRADFKGQVTFLEMETVEEVRRLFKLPKLPASVFRRNLIVRDMSLREWMGKRFRFQGLEFEGAQECRPCHWMDRAVEEGTESFLKKEFRGGLRAKIITSGILRSEGGKGG